MSLRVAGEGFSMLDAGIATRLHLAECQVCGSLKFPLHGRRLQGERLYNTWILFASFSKLFQGQFVVLKKLSWEAYFNIESVRTLNIYFTACSRIELIKVQVQEEDLHTYFYRKIRNLHNENIRDVTSLAWEGVLKEERGVDKNVLHFHSVQILPIISHTGGSLLL